MSAVHPRADARVRVSTGSAAGAIIEHAAHEDADLVVVGRGRGVKLLGSTALRILRKNDRALLMIRARPIVRTASKSCAQPDSSNPTSISFQEDHMYQTSNDLSLATRRSLSEMLNEHLADAIDLHLQAKQAHWNIKRAKLVGLHELFDRVASQARDYADDYRRESGRARWSGTRNPPGRFRAVAAARISRPTSATGGLMCGPCRMPWRRSDGARAERST